MARSGTNFIGISTSVLVGSFQIFRCLGIHITCICCLRINFSFSFVSVNARILVILYPRGPTHIGIGSVQIQCF